MPAIFQTCSRCGKDKNLFREFYFHKRTDAYYSTCKKCHNHHENPLARLRWSSMCSASTKKIEHTITLKDIPKPTHCCLLGIKLDYRKFSRSDAGHNKIPNNAASIDRIDSSLGYIPGNIQVISWLANRMKNSATKEQLVVFARNVLKMFGT